MCLKKFDWRSSRRSRGVIQRSESIIKKIVRSKSVFSVPSVEMKGVIVFRDCDGSAKGKQSIDTERQDTYLR